MSATTTQPKQGSQLTRTSPVAVRLVGAVLALAVAIIHVLDQGGFPGNKAPSYVGISYYLLEAAAVIVALGLLIAGARNAARAWALAVGVALGPIIGFVLSRGPGMPSYTDDKGNWAEPIGILSLIVEGLLLAIATIIISRSEHPTN